MQRSREATFVENCFYIPLDQGGEREMEMNLNKLSEIERFDWSRAISSKRDVAYGLASKRLLF